MQRNYFLLLGLILLAGCTAQGNTRAPVEDRTGDSNYGNTVVDTPTGVEALPYVAPPAPQALPEPANSSRDTAPENTPHHAVKANAAVTSLVSIADNSIKKGDYKAASAALERALRHDAKNADLWHRLAQLRLRQSELAQAESLALKSNALADGNKSLMSRNWTLISKSRRLRGDGTGADAAEVKAYQLTK